MGIPNLAGSTMKADKRPNLRIMHTEQCSNGIERGHAQRNIHGSDAKRNEFTAPRSMLELEQTRVAYGPTQKIYQTIAGHRKNVVPKVT